MKKYLTDYVKKSTVHVNAVSALWKSANITASKAITIYN